MSNMVVQTNVLALNAHRNMTGVGAMQAKASQKLSSGFKINSAADDAAGLAISEKMRAQIRGLDMASKNSQDAQSLIQTAEGGMQEIDNMLQRIRELTVQASNDTNEHNTAGTGDRQKIQDEINQLTQEIDSMADRVEFNKKKVIDGSFSDPNELVKMRQKQVESATNDLAAASTKSGDALNSLTTAQGNLTTAQADGKYTTYQSAITAFEGAAQDVKDGMLAAENGMKGTSVTSNTMSEADLTVLAGKIASANIGDVVDGITVDATNQGAATAFKGLTDAKNTAATDLSDAQKAYVGSDAEKAIIAADAGVQTAQSSYDKALKDEQLVSNRLDQAKTDLQAANTNLAQNGVKSLYFQVGSNANQGLSLSIGSIKSDVLGVGDGKGNSNIDVLKATGSDITATLDRLDNALSYVTTERSKLGAASNRLDYTMKSLDISSENLSAAESRIRDTDMAKEMMNLTKANVLQQASVSMLAQANQAPQSVLQLLQ